MKGKGLNFSKSELEELYLEKKLSLNDIGSKFNCDGTNILYWLKKYGIKRRPSNINKIHIPKEILEDLYWNKNLKPRDIAKKFGIKNERTIRKKMEKYGIKRKSVSEALTKKFKAPFCGDLTEKAFLLGLRTGDFYARKKDRSIRLQTTTTHLAQIELLRSSIKEYGEIRTYFSKNKNRNDEWFIYTDLHESFDFLTNKPQEIPDWILKNDDYFYAFLSAYCDCELNWNFTKSHDKHFRYTFRLRAGDKKVLEQIKQKLDSEGLTTIFSIANKKGDYSSFAKFNFDIYEITVNKKQDNIHLVKKMLPYSKHPEKINKMNLILNNQKELWSNVEPKLDQIKNQIKKELLKNQSNPKVVPHIL